MTKPKKPEDLLPRGRPTKYKQEYCQQVIDWMAQGKSKTWCAAKMGIDVHTFIDWERNNPEFSAAGKKGMALSQAWWEDLGQNAAMGNVDNFNGTAWIFNVKNRFGWRDKVELSGDEEKPVVVSAVDTLREKLLAAQGVAENGKECK